MKQIIAYLLFTLIVAQNTLAASYLDKQLKSSKHAKKYNSVKIHTQKNITKTTNQEKIKDPKLIKLSNIKEIDSSKYNAKLKLDEIEFVKSMDKIFKQIEKQYEKLLPTVKVIEKVNELKNINELVKNKIANKDYTLTDMEKELCRKVG